MKERGIILLSGIPVCRIDASALRKEKLSYVCDVISMAKIYQCNDTESIYILSRIY